MLLLLITNSTIYIGFFSVTQLKFIFYMEYIFFYLTYTYILYMYTC